MRLQRLQFYAWLSQRSAEPEKKSDVVVHLSFVISRELNFYFNSKQQLFPFRKAAHEYTINMGPLRVGGSWR